MSRLNLHRLCGRRPGLCFRSWRLSSGLSEAPVPAGERKPDETGLATDKLAHGKADAWNSRNNPNGLRVEMNRTLADLPMNGATENSAWPDTYWPTYKDSTNTRWQETGEYLNDLSPVEKYDAAFNGWGRAPFRNYDPSTAQKIAQDSFSQYYEKLGPAARYVSLYKGNKKTRDAALAGQLKSDCDAKEDSECVTACESQPEFRARPLREPLRPRWPWKPGGVSAMPGPPQPFSKKSPCIR